MYTVYKRMYYIYNEPSCSTSGRELVLWNEGPVSLPFLPLSLGEVIACVIGPSLQKRKVWEVHRVFVMYLSFDFGQFLFFFLARFWDLFECALEQGTPASTLRFLRTATQTSGMVNY